uniref:Uncharacterized protein n=1 Tax=Caenorhabditis japonica TaxID=281687 RepID=A0A8R1IMU9_CAEJA
MFHYFQDHLRGKMFDDRRHIETYLDEFFNDQQAEFYARGIEQLPTRLQQFFTNQFFYRYSSISQQHLKS